MEYAEIVEFYNSLNDTDRKYLDSIIQSQKVTNVCELVEVWKKVMNLIEELQ